MSINYAQIARINNKHRTNDKQLKASIQAKFSVVERAIKQAYYIRQNLDLTTEADYDSLLSELEMAIVSNPTNW